MRILGSAAALVLVVGLVGCSGLVTDAGPTPEESLREAQETLRAAEDALGGEWAADPVGQAEVCPTEEGRRQFSLTSSGGPLTDFDEIEAALRPLLEEKGFEVERRDNDNGLLQLLSTGEGDEQVMFQASGTSSGFLLTSRCFVEEAWDPGKDYSRAD